MWDRFGLMNGFQGSFHEGRGAGKSTTPPGGHSKVSKKNSYEKRKVTEKEMLEKKLLVKERRGLGQVLCT